MKYSLLFGVLVISTSLFTMCSEPKSNKMKNVTFMEINLSDMCIVDMSPFCPKKQKLIAAFKRREEERAHLRAKL